MAEDLVRIQFEMTKQKVDDLDDLISMTSMRSRRELFDNALTFFEWGVSQVLCGNLVAAVDEKRGYYQPWLMPAFTAARRFAASRSGKLGQPNRARPSLAKQARRGEPGPRVGAQESRKLLEARTAEGVRVSKLKGATPERRRPRAGRRTGR